LLALGEDGIIWVYDGNAEGWDPVPMRKKTPEESHG